MAVTGCQSKFEKLRFVIVCHNFVRVPYFRKQLIISFVLQNMAVRK